MTPIKVEPLARCKMVRNKSAGTAGGFAAQDAIDVGGRAAIKIDAIRPVVDQSSASYEYSLGKDHWQAMPRDKRNDLHEQRASREIQGEKIPPLGCTGP